MQTILLHHQDVVIQNRRKLYSEPPSYHSVSDRTKKNKALLNGQCCFLFVLIFHLRTVTEVAEWVFKGLLNAQMNKSWPWMFPFRFPFSGVVEERTWELLSDPPLLSKPEISIAIATEWLHVFLATAFSHCYKKNRTGLLKTWIQVSPTSLVHTHTGVSRHRVKGDEGWSTLEGCYSIPGLSGTAGWFCVYSHCTEQGILLAQRFSIFPTLRSFNSFSWCVDL